MTADDASQILDRWFTAINVHDPDTLAFLMSEDHLFVDSLGTRVQDAHYMGNVWRGYFEMCPDYWIRREEIMIHGHQALMIGEAGGTIDGTPWRIPAAWKAVIREGKVAEWRVFADNKPVYDILNRRGK